MAQSLMKRVFGRNKRTSQQQPAHPIAPIPAPAPEPIAQQRQQPEVSPAPVKVRRTRTTLGLQGRDSTLNPTRAGAIGGYVYPDAVTKAFSFQQIKLSDLKGGTVSAAVGKLISANSELKAALEIHLDYMVQGIELEGNTRSKAIIQAFIDRMDRASESFKGFLKRLCYGIFVEGASSSELVYSDDGALALKLVYVSPWSLVFEKRTDDAGNDYYVILQKAAGKEVVLYDERDLDPTFNYIPVNPLGENPFGSSHVTSSLFDMASVSQIISDLLDWLQGNVHPQGFYALDMPAEFFEKYTPTQLKQLADDITKDVNDLLNSGDKSQQLVVPLKMLFTAAGVLDKSGIDGSEMIMSMLIERIIRGTRVSRLIFGGRRQNTGLNTDEARNDILNWENHVTSLQEYITDNVDHHFQTILLSEGNSGDCKLRMINNNPEFVKILAEIFETKMQGYRTLQQLRLFTREQVHSKVISNSFDLSDLDYLPDALDTEPPPMPINRRSESQGDAE